MNDNQNYFVRQGRTTSRVLNPPGGKTSFTLGTWEPPVAPKEPVVEKIAEAKENTVVELNQPAQKSVPMEQKTEIPTIPSSQQSKPVSANAFAAGSSMNGAQVMTGRPTSRVLYPGGGGGAVSWTLG